MLGRVIKDSIRLRLRMKSRQIKIPSEEPYKQELSEYFNTILGKGPHADDYWRITIKHSVMQKFQAIGLTEQETSTDYKLNTNIDPIALFMRVQKLSGVKLAAKAMQQLTKNTSQFTFVHPDIEKISGEWFCMLN